MDNDRPPEHRLTILSLVAFHDLQEKIAACGGDVKQGIDAFCTQNDGEGWMLPETLRLADYGLGHDDRAKATPTRPRVFWASLLRLATCPKPGGVMA